MIVEKIISNTSNFTCNLCENNISVKEIKRNIFLGIFWVLICGHNKAIILSHLPNEQDWQSHETFPATYMHAMQKKLPSVYYLWKIITVHLYFNSAFTTLHTCLFWCRATRSRCITFWKWHAIIAMKFKVYYDNNRIFCPFFSVHEFVYSATSAMLGFFVVVIFN